jgi:hypothetical protein
MKTRPVKPKEHEGSSVKDLNHACPAGESYQDIKNRAPTIIKTWQELMEGERDKEDETEKPD